MKSTKQLSEVDPKITHTPTEVDFVLGLGKKVAVAPDA